MTQFYDVSIAADAPYQASAWSSGAPPQDTQSGLGERYKVPCAHIGISHIRRLRPHLRNTSPLNHRKCAFKFFSVLPNAHRADARTGSTQSAMRFDTMSLRALLAAVLFAGATLSAAAPVPAP